MGDRLDGKVVNLACGEVVLRGRLASLPLARHARAGDRGWVREEAPR
jgi:hypothetical protein